MILLSRRSQLAIAAVVDVALHARPTPVAAKSLAARHNLPIIVVISLNGGWTADPTGQKPGRNLGYTRFDKFAESLGCHGEHVTKPEDIRPALERAKEAIKNGKPALVNVVTDHTARATTIRFTKTAT